MKTKHLIIAAVVAAGAAAAVQSAQAQGVFMGSSSYGGQTTSVFRNPDGSHTVRTDDGRGNVRTQVNKKLAPGVYVDDGKGGWQKWAAKPKDDFIGSSTYNGVTTTVRRNPDGSHRVITDDGVGLPLVVQHPKLEKGFVYVDDGKGGWKKWKPAPKKFPRVIGSSTWEGRTTTVTLNANGTHTVTVTDENGRVMSSETHAPGR